MTTSTAPGPSDFPAAASMSDATTVQPVQAAANDADDDCPEYPLTGCPNKPAGRPRDADKEARLYNLLHTAGMLFLQKGYGKVSLEMIAREAHVAVRTIYVKFGGKVGLLKAIITRGRARFFDGMVDLGTDPRPPREVLAEFCRRFLQLISTPDFASLYRMVMSEAKSQPELADAFYQAGPCQTREQLARFFSRADVAALLPADLSPAQLATHLLNCVMGDQMTPMLFPRDTPPTQDEVDQQVEQGLNLFFHGVSR